MTSTRKKQMLLAILLLLVLAGSGLRTTQSTMLAENDSSDETSDIYGDFDSMIG